MKKKLPPDIAERQKQRALEYYYENKPAILKKWKEQREERKQAKRYALYLELKREFETGV